MENREPILKSADVSVENPNFLTFVYSYSRDSIDGFLEEYLVE